MHRHSPRAEKKISRRPNLQGKFVSAPQHTKCTPGRARVNFRTFLPSGGDLETVSGSFSSFRPSFEGEDKKERQFFEEKVHP